MHLQVQDICKKYDVPTARYEVFSDPEKAKTYIREQGGPMVVKADGLAAGKGVIVAASTEEACSAVDDMLVNKAFGSAGQCAVKQSCPPDNNVTLRLSCANYHAGVLSATSNSDVVCQPCLPACHLLLVQCRAYKYKTCSQAACTHLATHSGLLPLILPSASKLRCCRYAGSNIVVEEFLGGEEASFFALLDGHTCLALASAQVCSLARLYAI